MSRYIGKNFNGVLFLLREPNSNGKPVPEYDNEWITKVLNFEQEKNANKYRKTFCFLLNSLYLKNDSLPNTAFDNIKTDGGLSRCSHDYKDIKIEDKGTKAIKIIDEINPTFIFACLDIYDAIKKQLSSKGIDYIESNGLKYRKGVKNKITYKYNGRTLELFQIYHPSLGWDILT